MSWHGPICQRCSRRIVIRFAVEPDVWERVIGKSPLSEVCPACFDELAEASQIAYVLRADGALSWSQHLAHPHDVSPQETPLA